MTAWPDLAWAAEEDDYRFLGLTNTQLAIAIATVVTGARVAFVTLTGGTVFGRSVGSAVLAVYLAHVVAEGLIYGVGAGAGTYLLSGTGEGEEADVEMRPAIRPEDPGSRHPQPLPLEMARPRKP